MRGDGLVGYVATRYMGEVDGESRELAVVQAWDGARIVPAAALVPIDRDAMVERAGRGLESVLQGILAGGLDLCDAQVAWERALARLQAGVEA